MVSKPSIHTKLFTFSLILAGFASQPSETILSLLLIDIAQSFNTSIGTMGQIRTSAAIITVVMAFFSGILSVQINPKTLLLTGLSFYIVSSIGCYLAQSFSTMLVSYSLSGIGLALVYPMVMALIGEYIPLEKRPHVIGYFIAGSAFSFFVGGPVFSFLTQYGGWRSTFLYYILPIAIFSTILFLVVLPSG